MTVVHATSAPPTLRVDVEDIDVQEYAAVPTLRFTLGVDGAGGRPIRGVVLETQINVAAARRSYNAAEKQRLVELFGPPAMWGTSLRSLLWTRATVYVPPFTGGTRVDVPVACTYDFEVTVVKYFHALEENAIPLEFLFTGSMFYTGEDGRLQTARIPWDTEADFRLPVQLWRTAMERHFSDSAWVRLRSDTLGRLYAYKARNTLGSLDDAVRTLLSDADGREGR